ncbi:hypothetical protein RF11_12967 [Thelohanellus kitauei]|uniref:Uncharacterized protein n=1 Tax=Thelohanellus kitauei TaxID=669202 RepID=A0A0C2J921_THEKT|nr:hypothetical protein RF11_12967 [Thelohanellus kitauei]
MPATRFNEFSLPIEISEDDPISYDINGKAIYLFENQMVIRFDEKNGIITDDETHIYRFAFKVVSMTYDYSKSLLFLLDTKHRLFVISVINNYIKLLSFNVTNFKYHMNTL